MSSVNTRSKTRNQIQIDGQSINECGIYNIVETKHDGDCLFSSIFDFTSQNPIGIKNPPQSKNEVRTQTVDHVLSRNAAGYRENWDRFFPSISYNLETKIYRIDKYGSSVRNDEIIRLTYRRYMSKHGNFGTFSELCAAAELYGFTGYIFQQNESNEYICYDFGLTGNQLVDKKKPQLILLFTGPIDSGHFRRLEPSIAPTTIQPGKYKDQAETPASGTIANKITIKRIQDDNSLNKLLNALGPKSNTQPQQDFECDICKKRFETKRGLSTHRNVHNDKNSQEIIPTDSSEVPTNQNKPPSATHNCKVCGQSFSKQGLAVHMNRHAKEANDHTTSRLRTRLGVTETTEPTTNKKDEAKANKAELDSECRVWNDIFENCLNEEALDSASFDEKVSKFQKFLFKANQRLPGPQHPSVKFYRLRKQNKNRRITSAQQSRSSNPQRTDARSKQRRRDKFQYDLAQYWYYNQRKKSVRMVMSEGAPKQCIIKMDILVNHFKDTFEQENNKCLETYPHKEPHEDISLCEEDIETQIKRIALDTSSGTDRILVKTLRQLSVAKSIASIGNVMLRSSFVPTGFRQGKMILSDKDGDVNAVIAYGRLRSIRC